MQYAAALFVCKLFLLCILLWSAVVKFGAISQRQEQKRWNGKKWVMSDMYRENWERQGVMGRIAEMGRSVAPWVLVTGRASSEDGMFQRNMLPIHGGQEIKLSLSLSLSPSLSLSTSPPPFPLSPHSFTLNSAACLFTSHSHSHSLILSAFPPLSIFLQFKWIPFFSLSLSCLGYSHSMVVLHYSRLVV